MGSLSTSQLSFSLPHLSSLIFPLVSPIFKSLFNMADLLSFRSSTLCQSLFSFSPLLFPRIPFLQSLPIIASSVSISTIWGLMMTYEARSPNCGAQSHTVTQKKRRKKKNHHYEWTSRHANEE